MRLRFALLALLLWVATVLAAIAFPLLAMRNKEAWRGASGLVNASLDGYGRESLSSRIGRTGELRWIGRLIDAIVRNHCYECAVRESPFVMWLRNNRD